jgi:hypothetical protein
MLLTPIYNLAALKVGVEYLSQAKSEKPLVGGMFEWRVNGHRPCDLTAQCFRARDSPKKAREPLSVLLYCGSTTRP